MLGEANDVFKVIQIEPEGYVLDTGFLEPRDKCFKIPNHLKKRIRNRQLPIEDVMNLTRKET